MTPKTMTPRTSGAVLYARVSTGEQAEHGTSLAGQKDACRQKALALSLPIVAEYEDAGVSGGFLLTRQGMQAALVDIQAGRADTLICANLSRYSRDVGHQQEIKKAVRAAGGRVVFCDMTFDDTPTGDLMFGIVGNFAQWERQEIARRTHAGRMAQAKKGIQPGRTRPPFGYHVVTRADVLRGAYPAELLGQYLVREEQAAVVRRVYAAMASGLSTLTGLARALNGDGCPSPRGAGWRTQTLHYMLTNPVYKGLASYGRFDHTTDEGRLTQIHKRTGLPLTTAKATRPADPETWITWPVPALVTEAEWEAAGLRLRENQRVRGGQPLRVRMLTARVYCPMCGGTCVLQTARRKAPADAARTGETHYRYYLCSRALRRRENPALQACPLAKYPLEAMEQAALLALEDAAQSPQSVAEAIAARQRSLARADGAGAQAAQEAARIDRELEKLAARHQATVKAQIAGILAGAEPEAYAAEFAELSRTRQALEGKKEKLRFAAVPALAIKTGKDRNTGREDFPRLLAQMRAVLTSPDVPGEKKRDIIGTVIEKVYCLPGGAQIVFKPGVLGEGETGADTFQTLLNIRGCYLARWNRGKTR